MMTGPPPGGQSHPAHPQGGYAPGGHPQGAYQQPGPHSIAPAQPVFLPRRRESPLALVGVILVIVLILVGVGFALRTGFQGYQNTAAGTALIQVNDEAVQLLNRNDYRDAYTKLGYVLEHAPRGSTVYNAAEHNVGVYWYEAAVDARNKGDLNGAQLYFLRAQPLLPEKAAEIQAALRTLSEATGRPVPAVNSPTPAPNEPASPAAAPAASAAAPPATTPPGPGISVPAAAGAPTDSSSAPISVQSAYQRGYQNFLDGLDAQQSGHADAAKQHYSEAVRFGSYLDYTPAWVTDARSRLAKLDAPPSNAAPGIPGLSGVFTGPAGP